MQSLMQVQHYILLQIDSSKFKHVYSRAPALLKRAPRMQWHISILSNGCQAPVLFSKKIWFWCQILCNLIMGFYFWCNSYFWKKPYYSNKHEYIFHSVTYWCFWSWQVNFGNWPAEAIIEALYCKWLILFAVEEFWIQSNHGGNQCNWIAKWPQLSNIFCTI